MTFWDFCHANPWLAVAGGIVGLIVAGLAFIAWEDTLIQRNNLARIKAQRPAERREGGET